MIASVPAHVSLLLGKAMKLDAESMPPGTAQWLFENLRFDGEEENRRQALQDKALEGTITAEENAELDDFVETAYMLDLLKAKAAASRQPAAASAA